MMIDYWAANNPRHNQTKLILDNIIGIDNIVLSAIAKLELLLGATNKTDLARISKQLKRFNIAIINEDITLKTIALIEKYSLSHGLALADGIIAATAIATKFKLFTYNLRDFKFISELDLFVP